MTEGAHRNINPDSLPPPSGYAHATVAGAGTAVYLGGQAGHRPDGSIAEDLVEQFDQACSNVLEALRAAGGRPEHLVHLTIYATDVGEYRGRLRELGQAWRRQFGKHYPAMALIGATELFDADARVELVGVAVVP